MFKRAMMFAVLILFVLVSSAFALGDNNNSNSATATGGNGGYITGSGNSNVKQDVSNVNVNSNSLSNRNDIDNRSSANSYSGAVSGSSSSARQAQGQVQGQAVGQSVSINEEHKRFESYAVAFPAVSAAEGTNSAQASYFLGSLGKANTETYKKIIPQIQTIIAIPAQYLSDERKEVLIGELVNKMTDANRTQRYLGFLWEDNSKNLFNLFGLLTMDSIWDEGQRPFQSKSDIK